ncbi:Hsp90 cochaperone [Chytriomyces hyalinus]|nr:Hsp90 cochaperone [Chytriomyces hyalinus]
MNPCPPEASPVVGAVGRERARIRRIIRTGAAETDGSESNYRPSLVHPTRPFTPACFSRTSTTSPSLLKDILPSVEGLKVSRHRVMIPGKLLPRRLDPLALETKDRSVSNAGENRIRNAANKAPVVASHQTGQPGTPQKKGAKVNESNDFQTLSNLIISFTDKIRAASRSETDEALMGIVTETFKHVRRLLENLFWLRATSNPIHKKNQDGSIGVSKTAEKEQRDMIVEHLMKWMQISETSETSAKAAVSLALDVEVEIAIGVCGLIVRITRDDRVLQNVFKLCFKLSKTDRNDGAFKRHCVYEAIVLYLSHLAVDSSRLVMSHKCDMAIYAVATLKNLSSTSDALSDINSCDGAVVAFGKVIAVILNSDPITSTTPATRSSQIVQLFIQITLTLRSLLSSASKATQAQLGVSITKTKQLCTLQLLIDILGDSEVFMNSDELMLNIARILSKASLDPGCLAKMRGKVAVENQMNVVLKFQAEKPQILRFLFVLGNLSTPTYDEAVSTQNDPTITDLEYLSPHASNLIALFAVYARKVLKRHRRDLGGEPLDDSSDEDAEDSESRVIEKGKKMQKKPGRLMKEADNEEVLVKIVRLVSNMAIYPESGMWMSQMIELEMMLELIETVPIAEHEELVLNLAGALANFTYYMSDENCLFQRKIEVLELMLPLLLHENPELVEQATRVYSNISRDNSTPEVQSWMCQHRGGVELLSILIDHPARGVTLNVCGILVNLFIGSGSAPAAVAGKRLASKCGKVFVSCGGTPRLIDVVQQSLSELDLEISIIACKALINLIQLQDMLGAEDSFLDEEHEERLGMLVLQYLDATQPKLEKPPPLCRVQKSDNLFGEDVVHLSDEDEEHKEEEPSALKNTVTGYLHDDFVEVARKVLQVLGCGSDELSHEVNDVGSHGVPKRAHNSRKKYPFAALELTLIAHFRFESLAQKHSEENFVKVDVDEMKNIAATYQISAMPTFKLFRNGKILAEVVGADIAQVEKLVAANLTVAYPDTSAMSADELKALGNKEFSAGNHPVAIKFFTDAIAKDPKNHVLYSNRSASYASMRDYTKALLDAEETVKINPTWAKGYSRKGAALHGLEEYKEAVEAYQAGLAIEPSNALLKKGLEEAEALMSDPTADADGANGLGKMFGGDVFAKIAANPKLSPFLAQPDYVQKIAEIQKNPSTINAFMQDPRVMNTMLSLMGLDNATAMGRDEMDAMKRDDAEEEAPKPTPKAKAPEPEPMEVEEDDEEKEKKQRRAKSDKAKEEGNALYKKRAFQDALAKYNEAFELDETNVTILTNKSAVLFEMGNYDECIKICEDAVEKGREQRADFKIIAKAFGRMGNAYTKKNDYQNAIKYYQKSLSEHRTPDVLNKLRETEKALKLAEKEAYRNPALADAAREIGNELFKKHSYAEAVKHYTEAIKRNDQDPRNYSNRAACYIKLMALPEADKDCDEAIKLDEHFIKAYIRKASIQLAKRDYSKTMDMCNEAKEKDTEGKHTAEIEGVMLKAYQGLNEVQSGTNREETLKRAMNDPEVQKIMGDPVMQSILQQMQEDPAAARDHMKNPAIASKIRTLINAGIISTR